VRDIIDQRIVSDVKDGKAQYGLNKDGIIDSQAQAGSWPELKSTQPLADSDKDGMPDEWEKKHGLDTSDGSDSSKNTLDKVYTNIEMYLNELVN
jgi:hypothetical protein